MSKKIFLILIFVSFLMGSFCFAQGRELEIEYPTVPGVETPVTTKTALPEYLRYIFTFAIIIAGLLAFGALIYGGIRYLTSAGDPTKMADAKAQVTAGILGLIILLSSYLILNTINPQLVLPKKPPIAPAKAGIRIYTVDSCCETASDKSQCKDENSFKIPPEGMKDLTDPDLNWGFDGEKIKSIEFLGNPGDLTVNLWPDKEFKPKGGETTVNYPAGDTEPCKSISPATYKSISLDWHLPGVYLYANNSCTGDCPSDECKIYQSGSATLPEFDNKTESIKFVYGDKNPDTGEYRIKYAAILHEKENYMGKAVVAEPVENDDCISLNWLIKLNDQSNNKGVDLTNKVSSVTVYLKPTGDSIGDGVSFYEHKNYTMHKDCTVENIGGIFGDGTYKSDVDNQLPHVCGGGCDDSCEEKITSMEIDGHYVALLFRHEDYDGDCEVFTSSDPDFRNNRIGQCGWLGRSDCLSSFIIKARK